MTRVSLDEADDLKQLSGTGIEHARAFASMAGSHDMIVPFRIFRRVRFVAVPRRERLEHRG